VEAGGLGEVKTESVVCFTEEDPLVLESGATLGPVEVAYETYGELSEGRDNAVFVCHALTGDAHAAGHHGDSERRGWWDRLIGPGKPIDTEKFFVISPNLLGGCQGTTGPSSINPSTGERYGLEFPMFSVRDLNTVHRRLLEKLEIKQLHAALGGSLGGMQALQWAIDFPQAMERCAVICASAELSAMNIAFSTVAREAIMRDPDFQGGRYHESGRGPNIGLAVARMMAHITYLSEESFAHKFGRARRIEGTEPGLGPDFEVEHYLHHQGASFLSRFDALTYLYLTRTMDYFTPFDEQGLNQTLRGNPTEFLAISFSSDWRFAAPHSERIVSELKARQLNASHSEIESPWGHDSFLLDVPEYHEVLAQFLQREAS
jgi:homoserine O-acetyltransferase/O-succinyltransferase